MTITERLTNLLEKLTTKINPIENTVLNLKQVIYQVSKWGIEVDQDTLTVDTKVTQSYVDDEGTTQEWMLSDGEYELEDGKKIQVNAEGVIVLITDKNEAKEADTTDETETKEEVKTEAKEEVKTEETTEETTEEVTDEYVTKEEFITLIETIAAMQAEIDILKGEETEETEETETKEEVKTKTVEQKEIAVLKAELKESKESVAEPIINEESKLNDDSFTSTLLARIEKQRK